MAMTMQFRSVQALAWLWAEALDGLAAFSRKGGQGNLPRRRESWNSQAQGSH